MDRKERLLYIINYLGVNAFFRLVNRAKDLCLMYHGVVPDDYPIESWLLVKKSQFSLQLNYLRKYWEVVHIDAYINGRFQTSKPKAIITFDDGYQNNYSIAYPILKELNLPATIYIVTDFIDRKELFWFDKVIYSIQAHNLKSLALKDYFHRLGNYVFRKKGEHRWNDIANLLTEIKSLGATKVEEVAQYIFDVINPCHDHMDFLLPLTTQQITEMSKSGLIEIGSHTAHHEILTDLTLPEVERTIIRSINAIKEIMGKPPKHFCYPNGNYSTNILNLMSHYKFGSAMTVRNDLIERKNFSKYEIPRISVGPFDSISDYKATASGLKIMIRDICQFAINKKPAAILDSLR